MKKIIMILLVVATMGMAEESVQVDTNDTAMIQTTTVEQPVVEKEGSVLSSVSHGAGVVVGAVAYSAVAIITSPLHLFNLNK